jgi:hypothetical protein
VQATESPEGGARIELELPGFAPPYEPSPSPEELANGTGERTAGSLAGDRGAAAS